MIVGELKNSEDISYKKAGIYENTRFEKIHNVVFDDSNKASVIVASEIASLIKRKQGQKTHCVLGLATGSSPIKVYDELIRLHREEGLSFENVITFNLDEYYQIEKQNIQSYYYFMHEYFFDHVNIKPENVNIPEGNLPFEEMLDFCNAYEKKIKRYGGLDFQLLGIGRTGHIGFNEPGSHYNSRTRFVTLDHLTRRDASASFHGLENVPRTAITMGVSTVLESKRIILLGWGENKANIIKKTIEGQINSQVPATYLQNHKNTTFILDIEAASDLTRIKTPWLVSQINWTPKLVKKAVFWLCDRVSKSILRLTDKDYNNNGLGDLVAQAGSSHELNIKIFNDLQHTITGWPGGKPNVREVNRPERALPAMKRVIIFSPHPDDDVISMGGTFEKLVRQGHEVHVVYQTSGNIAVSNHEALKFIEVAIALEGRNELYNTIIEDINQNSDNAIDKPAVRNLKGIIRQRESIAAARYVGIPEKNTHFLNLPFYETGTIKKKLLGPEDVNIMCKIIREIEPHQIYAAGDLADPHGTHKVCLDALLNALEVLKSETFMKDCWVWLYRGAWLEWDMHEIDMAVPMSPDQVLRKRKAIFFHQSQKDGVMFQGDDAREFWVRAEERNKGTASKYYKLGLTDYAAIEAFKRYVP